MEFGAENYLFEMTLLIVCQRLMASAWFTLVDIDPDL